MSSSLLFEGRVARPSTPRKQKPLNFRVVRGQPFHTTQTKAVEFPGAVDKNEGVVKRHLFAAMLCSTAWISERVANPSTHPNLRS